MKLYQRTLLLLLFLLATVSAQALTAGFTTSPSPASGCPPLVVNFNNTSTGATSYSWNFGNGFTSVLPNPATTYTLTGMYTVTLTAYSGSSSATATMVVTVHPLPTVTFVANDTTVCPGAPVTFTSTSVGGGGSGISSYIWGFGDGSSGSGPTTIHPYTTPGYFNVLLSVTNTFGCNQTATMPSYIHVLNPPVPSFFASPATICSAPGSTTFTNTTTGTGPLTYWWNFGNSSTSPAISPPPQTYLTNGIYNVKLRATDANGCMDSITAPLSVGGPTASFTSVPAACLNTPVTFYNTSTFHSTRTWNFGDGSAVSHDSTGTRTYTVPGTYTVTLIINNGACSDTVTHTITIQPPPAGGITISPGAACPAPTNITFTGTGVPSGSSVAWTFGDGTSGGGNPVTHTYTHRGIKNIKMVVTSGLGCMDSVSVTDTIYDLIVQPNPAPSGGCVPLTVTFNATAKTKVPDTTGVAVPYPWGIASCTWNFGDGSGPGSGTNPTHIYTAVGVYPVTLTLTTGNGCTVTVVDSVRVGTPPVISVTVSPTHVCFHNPVTFLTTVITGPVSNLYWDFDDGSAGFMLFTPATSHIHVIPGTFTTTVTPYYNGCPGTPVVLPPIVVDSPKAIAYITHNCSPRTQISCADSSMGATSIMWLFGDGDTSTLHNPVHTYSALGTYTVSLCAYNAASGCRDTDHVVINLVSLTPNFTGSRYICPHDTAKFTASVTGTSPVFGYKWYVNGGINIPDSTSMMDTPMHTPGRYTITLVTKDMHGCFDTVTKPDYLTVAHPAVGFWAAPTTVCAGAPVTFTDTTTDFVPLTTRWWRFGDGNTASVGTPTVTHSYTAAGTYNVTEIVTDSVGCMDSLTKPTYITVTKPTASFTMSTTHPCPGVPVLFTSTSSAGVVSWYWAFGDGDTSTAPSPMHAYSVVGSYIVKLVVTDGSGCSDSMVTPAGTVSVSTPTASFTVSDTFGVCTPLWVNFTSTSIGGVSYKWLFGNGDSSILTTPVEPFNSSGVFTVSLEVTNADGCKDTAYHTVTVFGYAGAFTYDTLFGCAPLTVNFSCNVSNVSSLTWDFNDGVVYPSGLISNVSHTYSVAGAYIPKLILSDNTGCQNTSLGLDTIKVDAIYPKISTNPNPVCEHGTFHFIDSSTTYWSPVNSWVWRYDTVTSYLQSPTWYYDVAGTYTVSLNASNAWGCTASFNTTLTVYPPPVITTSADTVVCVGDAATLYGHGGVSYTWAGPGTLSCVACNPTTVTPLVPSIYTVTGTDARGCTNTDTVRVSHRTHTIASSAGEAQVCRGVPVPVNAYGGTKYTWIPAEGIDNPFSDHPNASPAVTTTYSVVVQLAGCIPDTTYLTVTVFPTPTIDAGKDQYLPEGSIAQIDATGSNIQSLRWSPAEFLNCDTCLSVKADVPTTTKFVVEATSPQGCKATDDVMIYLYCSNSQVFIPNSFTPNNDGKNDIFYPRGKGIKAVKVFRVYNRWGELMHERLNCNLNDPAVGWDGSYLGDAPRHDVYVYYIEAICNSDEPIFLKGDVTILR